MGSDDGKEMQKLWQEQPNEGPPVTIDDVRARAQQFDARTRRWRMVGAVGFPLLALKQAVEVAWPGQDVMERVSDSLLLAALLYVGWGYWKYLRHASAAERGRRGSVDFYREQLVRERNLAQQGVWAIMLFVPGIALNVLGGLLEAGRSASQRIVPVTLAVAVFVVVVWVNARGTRRLEADIEALER